MANTTWTPNETQKAFMNLVGTYENGVTIFELKMAGYEFKTGSVNILITKGLVKITGERIFNCDIVYNGQVVGHTTKKGSIYELAR